MHSIEEVFNVIKKEREYQDRLWGKADSQGKHSISEYILYIQDYLAEARGIVCRMASPKCDEDALHIIRKIAAMAVCCMEQNGIEEREMKDLENSCDLHGVSCDEGGDPLLRLVKNSEEFAATMEEHIRFLENGSDNYKEAQDVADGLRNCYITEEWWRGIKVESKTDGGSFILISIKSGVDVGLPSKIGNIPIKVVDSEEPIRVVDSKESTEDLIEESHDFCGGGYVIPAQTIRVDMEKPYGFNEVLEESETKTKHSLIGNTVVKTDYNEVPADSKLVTWEEAHQVKNTLNMRYSTSLWWNDCKIVFDSDIGWSIVATVKDGFGNFIPILIDNVTIKTKEV